ncbi:MAG: hypothetical protein K5873_04410 [Treponema sp.]|nr:hypothetical protein [Treponema sp.]
MTKAELSNLMDELIQVGIQIFNGNFRNNFITEFQPKKANNFLDFEEEDEFNERFKRSPEGYELLKKKKPQMQNCYLFQKKKL